MIEIKGDIWFFHKKGYFICIPTNGYVARDGHAVMGRGLALECTNKIKGIQFKIGKLIKEHGNIPNILFEERIITFPTKVYYKDFSNVHLIKKSSKLLKKLLDLFDIEKVYVPHVGCGNGKLSWDYVKENIEDLFVNEKRVVFVEYDN